MSLHVAGGLCRDGCQLVAVGLIVRVFNDHFLAHDATLGTQSQQAHCEILVHVDVEYRRVLVGLVCEEDGDGRQYHGTQQLAEPYRPLVDTCHTHTRVVKDVEDDEHDDGDDDRHTKSTFTDDGAQRCSDEEEDDARQRQCELVDGLHHVHALFAVQPVCPLGLVVHVGQRHLYIVRCLCDDALLVLGTHLMVDGVVELATSCHLFLYLCGVVVDQRCPQVGQLLGFAVVLMAHRVVELTNGVQVVDDTAQSFRTGVSRDAAHLCQVEAAVKVQQYLLCREGLSAIGHIGVDADIRLAHILKPLTAIQCQQQVLLLFRRLDASRVGQDDGSILVAAIHAVYHDAIEHATIQVFLLYIEVRVGNAVIEDALRNLYLGVRLLHGDE